jgi:hypothetical protein
VNGCCNKKKRKEEGYPWKGGASSGNTTNLKQSILETFDIYASNIFLLKFWINDFSFVHLVSGSTLI